MLSMVNGLVLVVKKQLNFLKVLAMRYLLSILVLALSISFANAQNPVITLPNPVVSDNASSTIAATNTFQSIWVLDTAVTGRTACTVQNNGTNTMWVFFGPIADATKGKSVVLTAGQATYCNSGIVVLKDQVSITGTSGDAFYAARQ